MRNSFHITEILTISTGAPVLVYCPEQNKRESLISLLNKNGEDVVTLIFEGAQKVWSIVVKQFLTSLTDNNANQNQTAYQQPASNVFPH